MAAGLPNENRDDSEDDMNEFVEQAVAEKASTTAMGALSGIRVLDLTDRKSVV